MIPEKLLNSVKENPFLLAPMAGITDAAFRSFMRELGCGVVVTELVSATGLKFSSEKTRKLMEFDESQHPVGIQIFGEDLDSLDYAARVVEQMGADFVDLNFGCPVPKVVKRGAGAALLRDLKALQQVLRVVKSAVSIPVTIKVRTGWDEASRNAEQVAQVAADEGITWMAIHGRTRAQGYSGQADWDYIGRVVQESPIPIIGNGDLTSATKAQQALSKSGCLGVMIGRGCLKNPWIFRQAMGKDQEKDFKLLLERLFYHLERRYEDRLVFLQVKKFAAWYSAGYPDSAKFRRQLFELKDKDQLKAEVFEFFALMQRLPQTDTSHEPFLMGGHG